jgi:hypothetical protein
VKPEEKTIPMLLGNVSLMSSKLQQKCHDKNSNNLSKKHKQFTKCWIFEKLYNLLFKKARHSYESSYESKYSFEIKALYNIYILIIRIYSISYTYDFSFHSNNIY